MLYVTVGLLAMFGGLAFLGLAAIDQATELVFSERLATAHTTARILERDFEALAADARDRAEELQRRSPVEGGSAEGTARSLLASFSGRAVSPFFSVSGVWVLDPAGRLLDSAGSPDAAPFGRGPVLAIPSSDPAVLAALGSVAGATPLAAIAIRVPGPAGSPGTIVIVHTVGLNSNHAYVPAAQGRPPADDPDRSGPALPAKASDQYHLEVIRPDGIAVLGIGEDEQPGQPSRHFGVIRNLMRDQGAAALLHQPGAADSFEPHVMAVVPVSSTPFYLVLEQSIDVALALPLQLRERLLVSIIVGFGATLAVAWVTTRRVVKPTEELTAAAGRMANGDLTSPIGVTAPDEIGELAESLDRMRQHLEAARAAAEATNRVLESRVAERTARLGHVLRKTISAQEDERYRLARELHDETAQTLAALSIMLDRARDSLDDESSPAAAHIREAKVVATHLLSETRRLILGLRPSVLDDLGLGPAVRWQCETTLGDRGLVATVDDRLGPTRLPSHVEVALFRIVQEAVNNVARHAQARNVAIKLIRDEGTVTVIVVDDGKGFDIELAAEVAGHYDSVGLSGMQERVALLNGRMDIQSAPGTGTSVKVEVPVGEMVP